MMHPKSLLPALAVLGLVAAVSAPLASTPPETAAAQPEMTFFLTRDRKSVV